MRFSILLLLLIVLLLGVISVHVEAKRKCSSHGKTGRPGARTLDPTGVQLVVKSDGINVIVRDALPEVIAILKKLQLPAINGTQHVPIIGDVDYALKDIAITSVELGKFTVTNKPPNTVQVDVSGVTIGLSLKWSYEKKSFPKSKGDGTATATTKDTKITVAVSFTIVNGKPVLKAETVIVAIGDLDVKISGSGLAWLLNLLEGLLKGAIKSSAQKAIVQALTDQINIGINSAIEKTPFIMPVEGFPLDFDFSLTGLQVADAYMTIGSKALLLENKTHTPPPFTPVALPSTPLTNDAVEVFVTEYMANAAAFSAWKAGVLNVIVNPEQVPPESPIKLNTTSLKLLLPELYNKFPNKLVQLQAQAAVAPSTTFTSELVFGVANGTVKFSVINDDKTLTEAFILGIGVSGSGSKFGAKPAGPGLINITAHVDSIATIVSLVQSNIGDINVANLNTLIKSLSSAYLPLVNKLLAEGISVKLPVGLSVSDPQVLLNKGYLVVAANVDYTPPKMKAAPHSLNHLKKIQRMMNAIQNMKQQLELLEGELRAALVAQGEQEASSSFANKNTEPTLIPILQ